MSKQLDLFKPAYVYTGYLATWLPVLDAYRAQGMTRQEAAAKLLATDARFKELMERRNGRWCYTGHGTLIATMLREIEHRRGQYEPEPTYVHAHDFAWARREHAFMLRAEGLKWREVAARVGVSPARAQQLSHEFGRRLKHAMRYMKVSTG